jgi:hypothetical protein
VIWKYKDFFFKSNPPEEKTRKLFKNLELLGKLYFCFNIYVGFGTDV